MDDNALAAALLAVLRHRTGRPTLDYAVHPEAIAGGFDTRILGFALRDAPAPLDGPLVLRLHRPESESADARFETVVHGAVAGLGYPCPPVLLAGDARDGLGSAFVVMPRIPGRAMLDALRGPGLLRLPEMLAHLQLALHALDPASVHRALAAAGFDPARWSPERDLEVIAQAIARCQLDGLRDALAWLTVNRPVAPPAPVVCHGDFHPLNVLVANGRVTGVVDWSAFHLRFAEPEYDVGATVALLSHGPLDVPRGLQTLAALGRRWLVGAYERRYQRGRALDARRVRYYEALRTIGVLVEDGMHRQAAAGVIEAPTKPSAFAGNPRLLAAAARRLQVLTGVRRLPG